MSTVLVVDDEQLFRDLLQALLRHQGHDVLTASNGAEAIEVFERRRPRVTLLDLNMPGMDGIATLTRIRAIDAHAAVVVLTGAATDELEHRARQLGVTDFLKKGMSVDAVLAALKRLAAPSPLAINRVDVSAPSSPVQSERPSLLVVEDEPNSRQMLAQFLGTKGYRVRSAADGIEALQLVQKQAPQVILLDLHMPGMNGVEVLRTLKTDGFLGTIIVLTGSQDEDLLKQALELGSMDVLGKPVDIERLELAIEVSLVLSAASSQAPTSPVRQETSRHAAHPPVVLVVEDDISLAKLLSDTLQVEGYEVLLAVDGDAAFRLLREKDGAIDVVLTDIMLPRINGLDLTTLIQGQWPRIKIIVCSGQLSSAQLANTGAAFLAKPFTPDELLALLRQLGLSFSGQQAKPQPRTVLAKMQATVPGSVKPMEHSSSGFTAASSSARRASILIVDDDPDVSRMLREFLSRQGHQIRFAATGGEALVLLHNTTPDLVIMDLSMPGMNGVEMLRRLKDSHPDGLPYGVIIVTGGIGDSLHHEAQALDIVNILPKPLDPIQLEDAIRLQLQQRVQGVPRAVRNRNIL
jgi:CheY-like chemotaxis protein